LLKPQLLSLIEGIRYDIEQARIWPGKMWRRLPAEIFETEQGYADRLLKLSSRMTTNWPTRLQRTSAVCALAEQQEGRPDEVKDQKRC
jgi:ATP-dependent helicase/nuclease subunit A